jgi:hypothetical protein
MSEMRNSEGDSYKSAVYRDGWRLVLAESTATAALALRGFLTAAAVNTLLSDARSRVSNGLMELGAGDGAELVFLGTDAANETINYMISGLSPVFDWGILATGVVTLGALTAGAAGAAHSGIETGDLIADTITETASMADIEIFNPADDTVAILRINEARNVHSILVRTDLGTAASALVLGRRLSGTSQNT